MKELLDTSIRAERAFIIGIKDGEVPEAEAQSLLRELSNLAATLGADTAGSMMVNLRERNPSLLVGTGKADEIVAAARMAEADSIIFDRPLSPGQQRNFEELSGLVVYDRPELIIKIFASRARTREASLQVELARLQYELPRLSHANSDLNRQKGGRYGTKDSGETKLELDKRQINKRIHDIENELVDVRKVRATQRKKRERLAVPRAAIVGYTNAGKSSLVNVIAKADVFAEDKLFATLDPTTRRMTTRSGTVLVTDTVGFIRNLPHKLVAAFKATLDEAAESDLLVHVLDAADPECEQQFETTREVLAEIGADTSHSIVVYNKIDKLEDRGVLADFAKRHKDAVFVSAKTGEGLPELILAIEAALTSTVKNMLLRVPAAEYSFVTLLYREATVISEEHEDDMIIVRARVPARLVSRAEPYSVDEDSKTEE